MKIFLLFSTLLMGLAAAASADNLPNSGRVEEILPAGRYTYLQVIEAGKETWLAIPSRDIAVGARVRYGSGLEMKSFRSFAQKRIFEAVIFLEAAELAVETSIPGAPDHPPIPAHPAADDEGSNRGRVAETIAAGPYTYLRAVRDGKERWLAIPRRDIAVGTLVRYGKGTAMKDFRSSALNRTFDELLFLGGVTVADQRPSGR